MIFDGFGSASRSVACGVWFMELLLGISIIN